MYESAAAVAAAAAAVPAAADAAVLLLLMLCRHLSNFSLMYEMRQPRPPEEPDLSEAS